jgi:flagellar hook assembly protein FlgD
VRTLAAGHHEAGLYQVRWDSRDQSGTSVASGTYLYRVQVGASAQVGQMTLLK